MKPAASPLAPAKSKGNLPLGCAIPFGLVFVVTGALIIWFFSLVPLERSVASRAWVATPCTIVSSELTRHPGSKSVSFSVSVRYAYSWEGHRYEGNRFDFTTGSTNFGVQQMRAAVDAHPPGATSICYVDPADPASAVIDRAPPPSIWFALLFLLFPVAGGSVIYAAWRPRSNARAIRRSPNKSPLSKTSGLLAAPTATADDPMVEVQLKPSTSRAARFAGLLFIALFWNGIISVFLFHLVNQWRGGGGFSWFLALFLTPFTLVGLALIYGALHAFAGLFAPPLEVRLVPGACRLGARVPFTWRLGRGGVRQLVIRLVAREEATSRQGTSTRTDKAELFRATVIDTPDPRPIAAGQGELIFPAEHAAPSLDAGHNAIHWELVVTGRIPMAADVNETYRLHVLPAVAPAGVPGAPEPRAFTGGGVTLWTVERFAPGETLVFTIAGDRTAPASGSLTVQLGWFTEGNGTRDAAIVWSKDLPSLATGDDRSFEVKLPAAPASFAGQLIAAEWRLEVLDAEREPLVAAPLVIAHGGEALRPPPLPVSPAQNKWIARWAGRR